MRNSIRLKQYLQFVGRDPRGFATKLNPIWGSTLLALAVGLTLFEVRAQNPKNAPLRVSSLATQAVGNGTLISIAADGSLKSAQTWHDTDGYHVVAPYASLQNSVLPSNGVKVRRVGQSLEILVQTKPGANVSAQMHGNRLNLSISGQVEPRAEKGGGAGCRNRSLTRATDPVRRL